MKTLVYTIVAFILGTILSIINVSAQMKDRKIYTDNKSGSASNPAMEKLTKKSDNALRVNFFKLINLAIYTKMQELTYFSDTDTDPLVDYRGMANIVFSLSADKKIKVLNVFGNNPKLVSFIKELLETEPLLVPQAVEGKYMLPVRF